MGYGMIISDPYWESKIRKFLPEDSGWKCEFSYSSLESFLVAKESNCNIHFLLMDVHLPGLSGELCVDIFRKFLDKQSKIVMLSSTIDLKVIANALKRGADGFLSKDMLDEKLESQLLSIRREGVLVSPDVSQKLVKKLFAESPVYMENEFLSQQEWSILHRLAEGDTYEQAASNLGMTLNNFRYHIKKLFKNLNIENSTSAVSWYLKRRSEFHGVPQGRRERAMAG
jgi:DNA-binding NarL/FixJ family response regulator